MLSAALDDHHVGTIALAGFMRILSPGFVAEWNGRIVNIHPRCFPNIAGSTRMPGRSKPATRPAAARSISSPRSSMPVMCWARPKCAIEPGDTPATLEQRILAAEHELYPKVLSEFVRR